MTAAYELWRGVMYCVGVFVTCNVGGMALRYGVERVSARMDADAAMDGPEGDSGYRPDATGGYPEEETPYVQAEPVTTPRGGQSFEEMQRQIDGTPSTTG